MAYFNLEDNLVLLEARSSGRMVTLNRTKQLNSLTYEMLIQLERALSDYECDSEVNLVILKGKGKAFCAGGDVVGVVHLCTSGHWSFAAAFYKKQLLLDYLIATYKKPLVPIINGIVMGGGAGLSMHARFRVVTENTVFAMPEVSIGHIPDVGASYFLSRLPGHFGEYLGLTGTRIDGREMFACGLATHFVLSKDLQSLEDALLESVSTDTSIISELINKFTDKSHVKQDEFCKRLQIINKCFGKETVEEILKSLENEVANGAEKWVVKAMISMKSASPICLKIFLRSIREGRMQRLEQCLNRDYRFGFHVIRGKLNYDFFEGARAIFFEKDKKPKWEPSKLEQVTDEMVNQFFSKDDLNFELPNNRYHLSSKPVMKSNL
ncbi:hypothetical protein LguiA_010838 [Lonicera macranthoides]